MVKFELNIKTGTLEKKLIIEELTKEETESKSSLGSAYGTSLFHCVYLGNRYCDDFLNRVKYYFIDQDATDLKDYRKTEPNGICVEFYTEN